MVTDSSVTLLMTDGRVFKDRQIVASESRILITDDDGQAHVYRPLEIDLVNPEPWKLGEGYKWFGKVSMAAEVERGNSDSDEYDFNAESIWRSMVDRYTLRGSYELDKQDGDDTKDTWKIRGKYDRFRPNNEDDYYGWQLFFEEDQFADLDLRTVTGPYVGRQFFATNYLDLTGEVGLVYVDEQFNMAEDDDFYGANWEIRLTSGWLTEISNFYVSQVGILNFDEIDGVLVNTTIGVSFDLFDGFEVAAEALLEYDGGAVEDVDDLDETYQMLFGYKW